MIHLNRVKRPLSVALRVFVEPLLLISLGLWNHIKDFILNLARHQQDSNERISLADFFVESVERVLKVDFHCAKLLVMLVVRR